MKLFTSFFRTPLAVCVSLVFISSFTSAQTGRVGSVTVAPTSQNVNAPTTTNENTGIAAPRSSAGAVSGDNAFLYAPTATPIGSANATLAPAATSGYVSWQPVTVSDMKSSAASIVSTYAPSTNIPPAVILSAGELCFPVNTPKKPIKLARTMVESGALFGVSYNLAMVRDGKGNPVPGLVTEEVAYPDNPEYKIVPIFLYKRVVDGNNNIIPGVLRVNFEFGQKWEVQTMSVVSSTGGHITGSFSNSSHSGGVGVSSSNGSTDFVRVAQWKGGDCLANREYVTQAITTSTEEEKRDCRTLDWSGKKLIAVRFLGSRDCRERYEQISREERNRPR